jgi:hypothetical protein
MEYVSHDPRAKVRAPNLLFLVESFQFAPSLVDELLKNHGMDRSMFAMGAYTPLQSALDLLREVEQRVGPAKLQQMGSKSSQAVTFPAEFDTVEKLLLALDMIYSLHHLGDVGHYHTRQLPDGAIEVRCETPYPRAYEHGVIEGFTLNPALAKGQRYLVDYVDGPVGTDLSCICTVRKR